MKTFQRLFPALLLSSTIGAAGCNRVSDENLSGKAEADPARLRQAQAEAESAVARSRAAEAAKTKGLINVEAR